MKVNVIFLLILNYGIEEEVWIIDTDQKKNRVWQHI